MEASTYFSGALDDVFFFSCALSEEDILNLCSGNNSTPFLTDRESSILSIQFNPNPASSFVQLALEDSNPNTLYTYRIFDSTGRLATLGLAQHNSVIDVSSLNGGIYYVKVVDDSNELRYMDKLIILSRT